MIVLESHGQVCFCFTFVYLFLAVLGLSCSMWLFVVGRRLLSSCDMWAPECVGSVVAVCRLSCPAEYGIFVSPNQGSNPHPLHWEAVS